MWVLGWLALPSLKKDNVGVGSDAPPAEGLPPVAVCTTAHRIRAAAPEHLAKQAVDGSHTVDLLMQLCKALQRLILASGRCVHKHAAHTPSPKLQR
jgi:hypothetical protein